MAYTCRWTLTLLASVTALRQSTRREIGAWTAGALLSVPARAVAALPSADRVPLFVITTADGSTPLCDWKGVCCDGDDPWKAHCNGTGHTGKINSLVLNSQFNLQMAGRLGDLEVLLYMVDIGVPRKLSVSIIFHVPDQ